jgi:uncharacterized membrane protein (UPF0127 family)
MKSLLTAVCALCLLAAPAWAMGEKKATESRIAAPADQQEADAGASVAVEEEKPTELLSITTPEGKRHDFLVELVSEPEEMAHGLMNRTSMDPDHGMLFLFREEGPRSFWMKDTLIPLDIVFIDTDGVIRNIGHGQPNDLTSILSDGDVLHVLEINGGRAEELGIGPGATVHHPLFGNALAQ